MDWGEIKSDWSNGSPVSFVNKEEGSSNIMDFTKADVLDDAMRFDVISSLNIHPQKKMSFYDNKSVTGRNELDGEKNRKDRRGSDFFIYDKRKSRELHC